MRCSEDRSSGSYGMYDDVPLNRNGSPDMRFK